MTYSDAFELLVKLVKAFEGCRLHAYRDAVGIWTIGYGETLGVTEGMVWTQEQADATLRTRLMSFMRAVYQKCPALYLEPPTRAVACTSLAYNIGVGAFGASSVKRKTAAHEFDAAAAAFMLWRFAKGKELAGLRTRRQSESTVYLTS